MMDPNRKHPVQLDWTQRSATFLTIFETAQPKPVRTGGQQITSDVFTMTSEQFYPNKIKKHMRHKNQLVQKL